MKIVLLSPASSIHTSRWANALSARGHEVFVLSQHPIEEDFHERVRVMILPFKGIVGYFFNFVEVRRILKDINPDIVNAHYASGYGTIARLSKFKPIVLSVWGSDVYDFPYKSLAHRWVLRKNLLTASIVASTSYCMAEQTRKIAPELHDIPVTPFGVNVRDFDIVSCPKGSDKIVIGTVKAMEFKYGIDLLLKAFLIVKQHYCSQEKIRLVLRLVGGGSKISYLKEQAEQLGISTDVEFVGRVPHVMVPMELAKLDIYVALSRLDSESFGVAVIEAGAAGKPVVVSDVGGLPEVVVEGKTGFIVERENPEAAASAIIKLIEDKELRHNMGTAARAHVSEQYEWNDNVARMLDVYRQVV